MQNNISEIHKALSVMYTTALQDRKEAHEKRIELDKIAQKLLEDQRIYSTLLISLENEPNLMSTLESREYPIIMGNASTRMSILNLGILPEKEVDKFHSEDVIFPLGYTAKRKYKVHDKTVKKYPGDKMFYFCCVKEGCLLEIKSQDNRVWSGKNVWVDFCKSFQEKVEMQNVAEFFGLTHPTLQKMIEGMGDISHFKKYVAVSDRK
ncbi:hypothetical protein EDEG_02581 [Edhazardia aedis USNM 41457]|uniref:FYR N-terminal domain-containing protein n=1 Tax=Edhazardia aedis (strain USNM 41457) TaxID=1003232 RepID=J9D5G1_EDHAE|nr:hypothetical protein EDEG_02581 [Edhazardia aedis USNM 41457]|eukprot:EJW03031.1 hypothetical protein EDEG_02581 [Edhazardia aedis USNM 41457]